MLWIRQSQDQWKSDIQLERDSIKCKNSSINNLNSLLQQKEILIQNMHINQKNELEHLKGSKNSADTKSLTG